MTTPSTKTEDVDRLCARDLTEIAMSKGMAISAEDIAAVTLAAATLRALLRERDALRENAAVKKRKTFPILSGNGARFDYQLVADHGEQVQRNHYQTIDQIAERGGLAWTELHAVLHNMPFQKMDQNDAIVACRALEARYLAALEATQ